MSRVVRYTIYIRVEFMRLNRILSLAFAFVFAGVSGAVSGDNPDFDR